MSAGAKTLCDLENGMKSGDAKDEENIYVLLKNASFGSQKLLLLQMIWIPLHMRRQGICKKILDALERRADRDNVKLAVGPLMADENDQSFLGDLCAKRQYQPVMPWTYIRTNSCNPAKIFFDKK